jgi:hypothetical protein
MTRPTPGQKQAEHALTTEFPHPSAHAGGCLHVRKFVGVQSITVASSIICKHSLGTRALELFLSSFTMSKLECVEVELGEMWHDLSACAIITA